MGGGGGEVAAVAAPEGVQAAIADLNRVVPWKCQWNGGCGEYAKNGQTHQYIAHHLKQHRVDRNKQQKKEAQREARRAAKKLAAGPSADRKQNRRKDMAHKQRVAAKAATKGQNNGKAKGGSGHVKAASRGGK